MTCTKRRKSVLALAFFLLLVLALPLTASADMGPKDSLTVYVENPPSEPYYLDLLTQNSHPYDNFHNPERDTFNQEMLALLYSYESEGWLPAFTEGTGIPLFGKLTGEPDGDRMRHHFSYFGVPDTYRIIIVTESGKVSVSEAHTRRALQSSVTYDYATNKTTAPSIWTETALQFLITFSLTLLLEGIVLLLFRISLKENWKVFLLTNLVTQIVLTFTVGLALIKSGTILAILIQVPLEIIILSGETTAYRFLLKGVSNKRKTAYGLVANLVSWIMGLLMFSVFPLFG